MLQVRENRHGNKHETRVWNLIQYRARISHMLQAVPECETLYMSRNPHIRVDKQVVLGKPPDGNRVNVVAVGSSTKSSDKCAATDSDVQEALASGPGEAYAKSV